MLLVCSINKDNYAKTFFFFGEYYAKTLIIQLTPFSIFNEDVWGSNSQTPKYWCIKIKIND